MAKLNKPPRRQQADDHTIARLREIATESHGNLLLADGPPSPDALLLDLCGEALHLLSQAEHMTTPLRHTDSGAWTDADRAAWRRQCDERRRLVTRAKPIMRRIAKLPAQTAAGIYAKALIVRGSRTGAECLARTLAADLVNNAALRASIWPAPGEGGAA